jgi:hypothetical protein
MERNPIAVTGWHAWAVLGLIFATGFVFGALV